MFFLLQPRPPPSATPTDTLFPYTTHFRSPFGADICLPLSTCFSPRRASGRAFERQAIPRRRRELMNQRTAASTPSRLARATSILAATALLQLRSEEHTSELQSLMRISYAVFCLKKKKHNNIKTKLQQIYHKLEIKHTK